MTVKQSGQSAGGPTSGAEDSKDLVDGALRIEVVSGGWKEEQHRRGGKHGKSSSQEGSSLYADGGTAHLRRDEAAPKMSRLF
jgi:hypothetical protein